MATISEALAVALEYLQAGQWRQAEAIYEQILEADPHHAEAMHLMGTVQHRIGRHELATEYIRRAIRLQPADATFHYNLGTILLSQQRLAEAEKCFREALDLKPDFAEAHNNLGNALKEQDELAEAVKHYRLALNLPASGRTCAEVHNNLGSILRDQGHFGEALVHFQEALALEPGCAEIHVNLGILYQAQERISDAAACFEHALRLKPDCAEAYMNLGTASQAQFQLENAIAQYRKALLLRPGWAEAHVNLGTALQAKDDEESLTGAVEQFRQALGLPAKPRIHAMAYNKLGNVLQKQGLLEQAEQHHREAIRLYPKMADIHNDLGMVLERQGKLEEAEAHYREALRLRPGYAEACNNLGNVFHARGLSQKAIAEYDRAIRLKPDLADAHWNRALALLQAGNFEEGWREFEWRWKMKEYAPHSLPQPAWDGPDLRGRAILLHAEMGLGDTLQFIRYAPLVKKRGGQVIIQCQRSLVKLVATCAGVDQVVAFGDALPRVDVQVPIFRLPVLFRTTLLTIPAEIPYLHADPQLVKKWEAQLVVRDAGMASRPREQSGRCGGQGAFDPGSSLSVLRSPLRIGIAWQGNPKGKRDRFRSVALARFAPLARLPNVRLYSLQVGPGREQIAEVSNRFEVIDLGSQFETFMDTAAAIKNLDLVITVDSAVAHCAGALGAPVWVLVHALSCWRWLLDREDSPWYPTMRLFRQKQWDDWDEVFQRVGEAVSKLTAGKAD